MIDLRDVDSPRVSGELQAPEPELVDRIAAALALQKYAREVAARQKRESGQGAA